MTDEKLISGVEQTGVPSEHTANQPFQINKAKRVRIITDVLLWGFLCVLLSAGFINARSITALYPPMSLRFDAPISGQTVRAVRMYSIEHKGESSFWPSFWSQEQVLFSTELREVRADAILFSGEATLVWPAEYLEGTAPGITDGVGCALSSELAWQLFGSTDVVGKTVEVDGTKRIIRGVFQGEHLLALLCVSDEDSSQNFRAVELSGGSDATLRRDIEAFCAASGLGTPRVRIMGQTISFLAEFLAVVPLLIPAVYLLVRGLRWLRRRFVLFRKFWWFVFFLGFALSLPSILEVLPSWLIPTRFSDFSFWSSLLNQGGDSIREFFSVLPCLRDVEGYTLLLKHGVFVFFAVCCSVSLCFRWHITATFYK